MIPQPFWSKDIGIRRRVRHRHHRSSRLSKRSHPRCPAHPDCFISRAKNMAACRARGYYMLGEPLAHASTIRPVRQGSARDWAYQTICSKLHVKPHRTTQDESQYKICQITPVPGFGLASYAARSGVPSGGTGCSGNQNSRMNRLRKPGLFRTTSGTEPTMTVTTFILDSSIAPSAQPSAGAT